MALEVTEFEAFPKDFARIDDAGIVVMTVPKAAHSSIMIALADTFASPGEGRSDAIKRWRSHGSPVVPPGYLSVGFCRHPLDRFRSCWQDKVATVGRVRDSLLSLGCRVGMSLDEFSELVAGVADQALDRHLLPQYYKFFSGGALRVERLFRYETLTEDWEAFRLLVKVRCGRRLADLPRVNVSAPLAYSWSPRAQDFVRSRYSVDLMRFG